MKILNLYAGLGGNRKYWGDEHQITSVEWKPVIADVYRKYYPSDTLALIPSRQVVFDNK
jgi:DNA (cytosine-5)-methyltransferase 1